MTRIGIREEDMYVWERRVPIVPDDARALREAGIDLVVQRSAKRAFRDAEYEEMGVPVVPGLAACPRILGLKEIPVDAIEEDTLYVLFSHTIKGQPQNMPMLQAFLDRGCTVIDYERIVDDDGRRLIYFGNYAGLAGMIDSLWALGQRLVWEGIGNPFSLLRRALDYPDLAAAKAAVRAVGAAIASDGLPAEISPLVIGLAGYGNVSRGAQEILQLLPLREIAPDELLAPRVASLDQENTVTQVIFREEHTVEPRRPGEPFDLDAFFVDPSAYRSRFERYLPHLDMLMNCVYWTPAAPRLVTKQWIRSQGADRRLRVIGDISCDVEGAIEITLEATEPDDPVYVYDAEDDRIIRGVAGEGPVVLAVEILPSELPREASTFFSGILRRYVSDIAAAPLGSELVQSGLAPELQRATIVYRGSLTPSYRHLEEYLRNRRASRGRRA
jgi:alpha-aminoadipic semialdehyde synthase